MAEIKGLLDNIIAEDIQNVQSLASGSNERTAVINEITQLHKLRIEEIKTQIDADGRNADRTREEAFQKRQIRDQVIDRCVKTSVAVAELVLPLICYGIWMNMGFQFEETGAYTSTTFKNLLNRFKPTKRG